MKNVINWDSEWECAHILPDRLQATGKEGILQRLYICTGGWACFRTEVWAHDLLCGISEQCAGQVIEYEWVDGDDCGTSLWQNGKENRYTPSRETPNYDSITSRVTDKVETGELCLAFHEKLDACWENCLAQWQAFTPNQIQEDYAVIAATIFCYGKLRELSWDKETIAYLHCLPDSLTVVRDILLEKAESELEWKFQAAIWAIEDRSRRLGMVSELSM